MRSRRLTAGREGILTLPADVCDAAGLQPGDILAAVALDRSFVLEVYRELLDGALDYMDDSALQGFALRFLSQPLTTLEPGGLLRIPQEAFPLPAGSKVLLFVVRQGTRHSIQIFREA